MRNYRSNNSIRTLPFPLALCMVQISIENGAARCRLARYYIISRSARHFVRIFRWSRVSRRRSRSSLVKLFDVLLTFVNLPPLSAPQFQVRPNDKSVRPTEGHSHWSTCIEVITFGYAFWPLLLGDLFYLIGLTDLAPFSSSMIAI